MGLKSMDEITILRIESVLNHIDLVLNDTKNTTLEDLSSSSVLLRATCFSLMQIGEEMNKLKEKLGEKYAHLPWQDARSMRNVIVHDYGKVNVELVYLTIKNNLPSLKATFEQVLKDKI